MVIPDEVLNILAEDNDQALDAEIADALLTKAALEVAHAAPSAEACKATFQSGDEMFLNVLNGQQSTLGKRGGFKPSKNADILKVQTEITRFWREDQSARGAYSGLQTEDKSGSDFWAQRRATAHATRIDGESKLYIESLLGTYDWIDIKRFGSSVSAHAWILVQHADDHPEFQANVLTRMEPYLENGGVKPKNYAYLWDRVAVNTGRKQRYGTQPTWECTDGKMELQPLEDPENVNKRRAAMKMDTVEKALEDMARGICR